jgi:hypothetical protein
MTASRPCWKWRRMGCDVRRRREGGIEPKRQPAKQANTPQNAPLAIRKGSLMDTRALRRKQKDKEFLRSAHQLRTDTGVRTRRSWPLAIHSWSPTLNASAGLVPNPTGISSTSLCLFAKDGDGIFEIDRVRGNLGPHGDRKLLRWLRGAEAPNHSDAPSRSCNFGASNS